MEWPEIIVIAAMMLEKNTNNSQILQKIRQFLQVTITMRHSIPTVESIEVTQKIFCKPEKK